LLGFAGSTICGLAAGNPTDTILARAMWVMVAFVAIGAIVGHMGRIVVNEHVRRREVELIPDESPAASDDSADADEAGAEERSSRGSRRAQPA